MDKQIDISAQQYQIQFNELRQNFNLTPTKFSQITGVPQKFINKFLKQKSVKVDFNSSKDTNLYNILTNRLLLLSQGFKDISPREKVHGVIVYGKIKVHSIAA